MKFSSIMLLFVSLGCVSLVSCGQDEVEWPEDMGTSGGQCGAWYPGGGADAGADDVYGVEEGKVFPCVVWESARLNSEDTFINFGDVYLEAKHGMTDYRAIVIIISAKNCTGCTELIYSMEKQAAAFEDAGALLIGMARRDLNGLPSEPDFSLDQAEDTLRYENWKLDEWYVTNDPEHHFSEKYDTDNPWTVIISTKDMLVRSLSNNAFGTRPEGVEDMLSFIRGLPAN